MLQTSVWHDRSLHPPSSCAKQHESGSAHCPQKTGAYTLAQVESQTSVQHVGSSAHTSASQVLSSQPAKKPASQQDPGTASTMLSTKSPAAPPKPSTAITIVCPAARSTSNADCRSEKSSLHASWSPKQSSSKTSSAVS